MPGRIVKATDITTGHAGPPTSILAFRTLNVFVDGVNPIVVGDTYLPHIGAVIPPVGGVIGGVRSQPVPIPHPVTVIIGSPNVFIGGIPVLREFDPLSCGDIAAVQLGTVFCN